VRWGLGKAIGEECQGEKTRYKKDLFHFDGLMIFGGRPLAVVFVAGWDRVLVLFYGKFRPIGGKVL